MGLPLHVDTGPGCPGRGALCEWACHSLCTQDLGALREARRREAAERFELIELQVRTLVCACVCVRVCMCRHVSAPMRS